VLYELLAASRRSRGPRRRPSSRASSRSPRPRCARSGPTVPPPVDGAVAIALQKLPADRFASAADFAAALERPDTVGVATARARRSARPARTGAGASPPSRPRRWRSRRWPPSRRSSARAPGEPGAAAPRPLHARDARQRAHDPLARWAVRGARPGRHRAGLPLPLPRAGRLVRQFDDLLPRALPGTTSAEAVAFSPDGRWVAFQRGTTLFKVPLAGGGPQLVADSVITGGFAWLDGGTIVFTRTTRRPGRALARLRRRRARGAADAGGRAARAAPPDAGSAPRRSGGAVRHPGRRRRVGALRTRRRCAGGRGSHPARGPGLAPAYADGFLVYPSARLHGGRGAVRPGAAPVGGRRRSVGAAGQRALDRRAQRDPGGVSQRGRHAADQRRPARRGPPARAPLRSTTIRGSPPTADGWPSASAVRRWAPRSGCWTSRRGR
jgi:hypothetical protein